MKKPVAVQMYSLREYCARDFAGTLKRVAEIGYKGIEPAGFYGLTPKEVRRMTEDLGMTVSSTHTPWVKSVNDVQAGLDVAGEFGLDLVAAGFGPDDFRDLDAIRRTADTVNAVIAKLKGTGVSLFMHNHAWEFERLNGRIKYDYLLEMCPEVKLEIDTYWAANYGSENPAEQVARLRDRAVLLHIKDGNFNREKNTMVAVGSGMNRDNIAPLIAAADQQLLRWLVVELDYCDTDMFEAVEESYRYLTANGLAEGNK